MASEDLIKIKASFEGERNRSRGRNRRFNDLTKTPGEAQEGQSLEQQAEAYLNSKIEPYRQKAEGMKRQAEELKKDLASGKEFMTRLTRSVASIRGGEDLEAGDREYFSGALNQFDVKKNKLTKDLSGEDQELSEEMVGAAQDLLFKRNKLTLVYRGLTLGSKLKKAAEKSNFSGLSFFVVLGFSFSKDLMDGIEGGLTGLMWGWNVLMVLVLYRFFFLRGQFIKKYLIRLLIGTFIIEITPFVTIFPAWTIMTLLLKRKLNKRKRRLNDQAEDVINESNEVMRTIGVGQRKRKKA